MVNSDVSTARLGQMLRDWRLRQGRGELQAATAVRIGVSESTYRKMERGDGGVAIRHWMAALDMMGIAESLFEAMEGERQLLDLLDEGTPARKRERAAPRKAR